MKKLVFTFVFVFLSAGAIFAQGDKPTMSGQKEKSLYLRLGGYDAIAAVSDDFIGRLAASKTLGRFVVGLVDDRLVARAVERHRDRRSRDTAADHESRLPGDRPAASPVVSFNVHGLPPWRRAARLTRSGARRSREKPRTASGRDLLDACRVYPVLATIDRRRRVSGRADIWRG